MRGGLSGSPPQPEGLPHATSSFNRESPGTSPGLPGEAERRINYMIILLVNLLLFGSVTVIVVWRRKGRR